MNEWHLIETLGKSPTVVSVGGNVKNWATTKRLSPSADVRIDPIIEQVRSSGTKIVLPALDSARD